MDPQLQRILNKWSSNPASVRTWPHNVDQQYTIEAWFAHIESGCSARNIAQNHYVDVAIFFLRDEFQTIIVVIHQETPLEWDAFKAIVTELQESKGNPEERKELLSTSGGGSLIAVAVLRSVGIVALNFMSSCVLAGGGLMVAVLRSAELVALNAIGFTSFSVLAGSVAAGIQSIFYGGFTAGLFSVCQSIGLATAVITFPAAVIAFPAAVVAIPAAVIASPAVIVLGLCAVIVLGLGVAIILGFGAVAVVAYLLYNKKRGDDGNDERPTSRR